MNNYEKKIFQKFPNPKNSVPRLGILIKFQNLQKLQKRICSRYKLETDKYLAKNPVEI